MLGALFFLATRSAYNRFLRQVQRVRQPRYALAIIAGAAYFWFFLLSGRPTSPDVDPFIFLTSTSGRAMITIGVFFLFASSWVLGRRVDALAFSPAEVHFLFPAPVTRRWLIIFKLARMQILILISAFIWTLLVRRGVGNLHPLARAAGFWLLFATISVHQVGAAMVHALALRHGAFGARAQRIITTTVALLSVLFAYAVYAAWSAVSLDPALAASNPLVKAAAALEQPLLHALMRPFELIGTTGFASSYEQWLGALPFTVIMFATLLVLVVRANFSFEEAAAEASTRVAQRVADFRQRGLRGAPRASARTIRGTSIPLSARGSPATAIVWKNTLAFVRSMSGTSLFLVLLIVGPMVVALVLLTDGDAASEIAIGMSSMLLLWSIILGPRFVRNDLRADLTQLSMLKTFPLSGTRIVAAEVTSATLSLTAIQMLIVLAALTMLLFQPDSPGSALDRAMVLALIPFCLLAVNAVNMSIQNGATLLFPAWTTLGLNRPTGVEAMGQNILMVVASVLLLALALLPAAVVGAAVWFVLPGLQLHARVATTVLVALMVLFAEVVGLMHLLGRLFDRTEPASIS